MTNETTRTMQEMADFLKTCRAVKSVANWGTPGSPDERRYLDLWDVSRTFKGDQTAKWFVDSRGRLNYDPGKGTRSQDFRDSVSILEDFLAANGVEARKVV